MQGKNKKSSAHFFSFSLPFASPYISCKIALLFLSIFPYFLRIFLIFKKNPCEKNQGGGTLPPFPHLLLHFLSSWFLVPSGDTNTALNHYEEHKVKNMLKIVWKIFTITKKVHGIHFWSCSWWITVQRHRLGKTNRNWVFIWFVLSKHFFLFFFFSIF